MPAEVITDLDFADDLALLTQEIQQAQEIITRLEEEAAYVGLYCNAKKTELQVHNHQIPVEVRVSSGNTLRIIDNFKYLGAWTKSSEVDVNVRKSLAWSVCHKLSKVWKSSLSRNLKLRLFIATVESTFLYGAETWTLTKSLAKSIDGCYTRMLRMATNVSWSSHVTNEVLYGNLPKLSTKIQQRRMRLPGHIMRHETEVSNKLLLWQADGRRKRGRRSKNYIDNLLEDTGLADINELKTLMKDRDRWKERVLSNNGASWSTA